MDKKWYREITSSRGKRGLLDEHEASWQKSLPARHQRQRGRAQIDSSRRSRLSKLTACEALASRIYERSSIEQPVKWSVRFTSLSVRPLNLYRCM